MSRMLGLRSTKWWTYMPYRSAKRAGRQQARAIERRETQAEVEFNAPYVPAESSLDVEPSEFGDPYAFNSHAHFDGERCVDCGTNMYDAMLYNIACNDDREPYNYTTETT